MTQESNQLVLPEQHDFITPAGVDLEPEIDPQPLATVRTTLQTHQENIERMMHPSRKRLGKRRLDLGGGDVMQSHHMRLRARKA